MQINVKRLVPNAVIPTRSNWNDAGLDLVSVENIGISPHRRVTVRTGLIMEIPDGMVGLIWPRSGLAVKNGVDILAGVVDSGYRGEILVALYNTSPTSDVIIHAGDRIAQMLIQRVELCPCVEVNDVVHTERGENGFGSSGV